MARIFIILAAALTALAAPLEAAQPQAAAAAEQAPISIPFNPPIDEPLRYRVTRTTDRPGRPGSIRIDYEIRFSRRPSGYRMHVRATDGAAPGLPADQQAEIRRIMMEASPPFVLLIDEDAVVEGMEDADAYWERMMGLVERNVRQARSGAANEESLAQAMALVRETSPEGRLNLLTQYLTPIIEFGGTELTIGEDLEDEITVEGGMGLSLRQQVVIRAERVAQGRLFIATRMSVPESEMRRATQEVLARIPAANAGAGGAAERERVIAQLAAARFSREMDGRYEVMLDSGLTDRFSSEERVSIQGEGETQRWSQTILIERKR